MQGIIDHKYAHFLNQARAGLWPARAWFLKIDPVRIIGMSVHVCVSAPQAINNQWYDMNLIQLVKQVLKLLLVATVAVIVNRHDLGIGTCCTH